MNKRKKQVEKLVSQVDLLSKKLARAKSELNGTFPLSEYDIFIYKGFKYGFALAEYSFNDNYQVYGYKIKNDGEFYRSYVYVCQVKPDELTGGRLCHV